MCFSAPASFVAGASLAAMGRVTVKKAKNRFELPFALIPLFFGVQQLIEGFVWISFGSALFHTVATYAFVMFSHVLWPIWVPFSVMLLEHDKVRRKVLVLFLGVGLTVGLSQFYYVLTTPVTSFISLNSIVYNIVYSVPSSFGTLMMFLYLVATCMSCAVSSHRMVKFFAFCLFVSFVIAYRFYSVSCFSVWCFFAAILSLIIFLQFHLKNGAAAREHSIA